MEDGHGFRRWKLLAPLRPAILQACCGPVACGSSAPRLDACLGSWGAAATAPAGAEELQPLIASWSYCIPYGIHTIPYSVQNILPHTPPQARLMHALLA